MRPPLPRLHAITDERIARRPDLEQILHEMASGGVEVAVHARGRSLTGVEHYALAIRVSSHPSNRLFVNDRLDVALASRAAGVQLSEEGLPPHEARRLSAEWWIGRSVHSLEGARTAQALGAEYLLVGPVYHTTSHPTSAPLGLAPLGEIARLGLPVIAIGGVTPERTRELAQAGAYGVAAIRSIWDAPDAAGAARAMVEAVG